jgi:predicted Zn-dependent protease
MPKAEKQPNFGIRHSVFVIPLAFLIFLCARPAAAQPALAADAQRGKQAMADGRFADAARIYESIVRALPDDAGMRLNLGMALSMAGRPHTAIPHLERAVKLRPELTPGWLFLGLCRLETGEPAGAAVALQNVTAAQPDNVRARELLGEALLALEQSESAAREFQFAADQQPNSARAWYGLGRSSRALGRDGPAREAFERLQALPPSPELHQFRAELAREQGKPLEAIDELRKGLQLVPEDLGLQKRLARALYEAKSYDEAVTLLERVRRRDPSAETRHLLGDVLLVVGRSAEAVKALEDALALKPAALEMRASLGRAYVQNGNPKAAIPHLEAAVTAGKDEDGTLHYQLARAYQAAGQPDLAKKMLARYEAIRKSRR